MLRCKAGDDLSALCQAVLAASVRSTTCSDEENALRDSLFAVSASSFASREHRKAFEQVIVQSLRAPQDATRVAEQGLQALHSLLEYERDGKVSSLDAAITEHLDPSRSFETFEIQGRADYAEPETTIQSCLAQIRELVSEGKAESSSLSAMETIAANPEWCDLRGTRFVVIGALSETSPTRELLLRGATVLAIDEPSSHAWDELKHFTSKSTSGILVLPFQNNVVGTNVMKTLPELADWVVQNTRSSPATIFVNLGESDPEEMFLLAAACDALLEYVCNQVPDSIVAHFGSCTEVQSVSPETVELSQRRSQSRSSFPNPLGSYLESACFLAVTERQVGGGKVPLGSAIRAQNHLGRHDANVRSFFLLNPMIDPMLTYLARLIQRWRAIVARAIGTHRWLADKRKHRVIALVLPMAFTSHVAGDRAQWAYARGREMFGMSNYDPVLLRAIGTLLMIRDLKDPVSPSNPTLQLDNPHDVFRDAAIHGGAWTCGFDLASLNRLAAILFILSRLATLAAAAMLVSYFL
jgi:hypothetical protein